MAFKEANIRSAFKASGLVPYDPSQVLDKLIYEDFDSRPSSQDSRSTISKTPVNTNQFKKQEARLEQLLSGVADTPMKSALDYVFKGAEMALNRAVLLEQEVRELRWANERLNTKKRRRNKQLTGLNGFTVDEAREAFQREYEKDKALQIEDQNQPRRRAPPRCSECGVQGHIRTRCPNRRTV
ncbi:hypothetical protein ASPACDRAFT_58706 [Aspergillus aculeatus ATCC 16872]|uniref:CCHC-type domain-containing protein n=1 Tax=Aspergillus aculeatus (strain ATCC 16872 / CBS 172.66 / WB 5094) TaxID=690307 RepID=A0A1L9X1X7_ASPA1|nr:uncharacterized protein ASPACDRAFT_58706 [Aspergillus aculeatus ATCC 16872]OJK02386.1 hypothetical protein ASPACDRAFT_58706 [Aspergillus aculeatus ATCC 16872]